MNNDNKLVSSYLQQSNSFFLIIAFGKCIIKVFFNSKRNLKGQQSKTRNDSDKKAVTYLSKNCPKYFSDFSRIHRNINYMKYPLSIFYHHIKELFDTRGILSGKKEENNSLKIDEKSQKVDKTYLICKKSVEFIFHSLINKCMTLLCCEEIIDLIIEKRQFERTLIASMESFEEISIDETEEYVQKYENVKLKCQIENIKKDESSVCTTVISSSIVVLNKKSTSLEKQEPPKSINRGCRASGDIENDIKIIEVKMNEKRISQISRIIKAQKWVQNIKKQQMINPCKTCKKINKQENCRQIISGRNDKNVSKLVDRSKRQRFIVKKSPDKIEENSSIQNYNIFGLKSRNVTKQFSVIKPFAGNNPNPLYTKTRKKTISTCKNKKNVKLKEDSEYKIIRKDVINLADELQKHYVKHSKNVFSTFGSVSSQISNLKKREKIDREFILQEIKKRLKVERKKVNDDKFLSDENTTIATASAMKTTSCNKTNISPKFVESPTSFSGSQDLLDTKFQTATNTTYKSIDSSDFPPLDSLDIRDINLIGDEIQDLIQRKLQKTC